MICTCDVRTIMALWRARALTPEQKVKIVEEESEVKGAQTAEEDSKNIPVTEEEIGSKSAQTTDDEYETKSLDTEESGSFRDIENVDMSLVYSSILSIPVSLLLPSQCFIEE